MRNLLLLSLRLLLLLACLRGAEAFAVSGTVEDGSVWMAPVAASSRPAPGGRVVRPPVADSVAHPEEGSAGVRVAKGILDAWVQVLVALGGLPALIRF